MTAVQSPSVSSPALAVQRPCVALQMRSIDALFLRALQVAAFQARVHSVFDRVINIECTTGDLFTLAAREFDNAPHTVIVEIAGFGATGIGVDDPVATIDGALRVGDGLVLHVGAASIWRSTLPTYATAPGRMSEQLRAARSYLVRQGVRSGMSVEGAADGAFALEIATALEQRSALLLEALAQARHADACRHAVSMLGLGPGLTPSGDDFLVGLFATLNLAGSPCQGWLEGGTTVLRHARHATHAISLAALTAAAAGRVRESIEALIESLLHGTPATLVQPLRRVLAIGATSGADLVAGILAGLDLILRIEATGTVALPLQLCDSAEPYRDSAAVAAAPCSSTGA